ncbi:MAG: hypothetical protein PHV17_07035 [Candidatus Omnitrophica bacterium]|nr:hypothetical protein [Candidatus Omnitrophota bacterium]
MKRVIQKFKKCQAMIEMAILAPVLLVTVGLIVTYACKMNNDQWVLMEAFRRALATSHNTNKIISYGTWDDRMMASVQQPIIGQQTPSSGSACVMWVVNDVTGNGEDPEGETYVKVNGGMWTMGHEYPLGEPASGGIETMRIATTGSSLTVNTQDTQTRSSRTGGSGEFMLYKINEKEYPQGRVHIMGRGFSGGD